MEQNDHRNQKLGSKIKGRKYIRGKIIFSNFNKVTDLKYSPILDIPFNICFNNFSYSDYCISNENYVD